jgi:hypothetical protein
MSYNSDPDEVVIFRASRTNPVTGEKEYARDHGKRAFRIVIKRKKNRKDE